MVLGCLGLNVFFIYNVSKENIFCNYTTHLPSHVFAYCKNKTQPSLSKHGRVPLVSKPRQHILQAACWSPIYPALSGQRQQDGEIQIRGELSNIMCCFWMYPNILRKVDMKVFVIIYITIRKVKRCSLGSWVQAQRGLSQETSDLNWSDSRRYVWASRCL